jgi:hypothetical protein
VKKLVPTECVKCGEGISRRGEGEVKQSLKAKRRAGRMGLTFALVAILPELDAKSNWCSIDRAGVGARTREERMQRRISRSKAR